MAERAIRDSIQNVRIRADSDIIGILVDSNIHHYTVTHETVWVSSGESSFGPNIRGSGYLARVPVYSKESKSEIYDDVCYLAAIAQLAQAGKAKLWTSHHLLLERAPHPRARYTDTGWFDFNLFDHGELQSIDGDPDENFLCTPFSTQAYEAPALQEMLAQSEDDLYLALLKAMNPKDSQDAWHIRTAEVHGLYSFLTLDRKLLRTIERQKNHSVFKKLKTKVMSPSMLGKELGLKPIALKHFDHQDSRWIVRSDLDLGGKRPPSRRHSD